MPVTATEVTIRFHRPPQDIFGLETADAERAAVPDLAGEPRTTLTLAGKKPGRRLAAQAEELDLRRGAGLRHAPVRPADRGRARRERLLFARQDTVEAAWRVVEPVLGDVVPVIPYARGSWGPEEADALLPQGAMVIRRMTRGPGDETADQERRGGSIGASPVVAPSGVDLYHTNRRDPHDRLPRIADHGLIGDLQTARW